MNWKIVSIVLSLAFILEACQQPKHSQTEEADQSYHEKNDTNTEKNDTNTEKNDTNTEKKDCFPSSTVYVSTLVGSPAAQGYEDGILKNAKLNHPTHIFAKNEIIYFSESANESIRFIKNGQVFTFTTKNKTKTQFPYFFKNLIDPLMFSINDDVTVVANKSNIQFLKNSNLEVRDNFSFQEEEHFISSIVSKKDDFFYMITGDNRYSRYIKNKTTITKHSEQKVYAVIETTFSTDMAFDSLGNLYILDSIERKIYKIDKDSRKVSVFVGNGARLAREGPIEHLSLIRPMKIAFDHNDDLYILEELGTIRKTYNGNYIKTLFENETIGHADGKSGEAKFFEPSGISIHDCVIYISDTRNNAIRQIKSTEVR